MYNSKELCDKCKSDFSCMYKEAGVVTEECEFYESTERVQTLLDLKSAILKLAPHNISNIADLEGIYYMAVNDVLQVIMMQLEM